MTSEHSFWWIKKAINQNVGVGFPMSPKCNNLSPWNMQTVQLSILLVYGKHLRTNQLATNSIFFVFCSFMCQSRCRMVCFTLIIELVTTTSWGEANFSFESTVSNARVHQLSRWVRWIVWATYGGSHGMMNRIAEFIFENGIPTKGLVSRLLFWIKLYFAHYYL